MTNAYTAATLRSLLPSNQDQRGFALPRFGSVESPEQGLDQLSRLS